MWTHLYFIWMGGFIFALVLSAILIVEIPSEFGHRRGTMVVAAALWFVFVGVAIYLLSQRRK